MSSTKITAPVTHYTGPGPGGISFEKGVAFTDDEAVIAYCVSAGYGVSGEQSVNDQPLDESELAQARARKLSHTLSNAEVRAALAEPVDPRTLEDGGIEVVGTRLRDAAVDPQPEDFLPPTNAGEANPHGPLVVAPGIHGIETQVVRPGLVHVDDTAAQEKAETAQAVALLVENQDVGEALPSFELDGSDTGPLGLSDPGSVELGVAAAAEVAVTTPAPDADADPAPPKKATAKKAPAKRATKRTAKKATAKKAGS